MSGLLSEIRVTGGTKPYGNSGQWSKQSAQPVQRPWGMFVVSQHYSALGLPLLTARAPYLPTQLRL